MTATGTQRPGEATLWECIKPGHYFAYSEAGRVLDWTVRRVKVKISDVWDRDDGTRDYRERVLTVWELRTENESEARNYGAHFRFEGDLIASFRTLRDAQSGTNEIDWEAEQGKLWQ